VEYSAVSADAPSNFPQQYENRWLRRGITLSGGPAARRTILARAHRLIPVLILDDALSGVDNQTA